MATPDSKTTYFVPDYPTLPRDIARVAIEGQSFAYPMVVRTSIDPPLVNQVVGNISFMLFSEPRKMANGKFAYGFFKLRGSHVDEHSAKRAAGVIIKEVDSKYKIGIAPIGHWLPITEDNDIFCKDILDINDDDEKAVVHLRDQVVKDKQAEERKIMRELREREEELKSGDIYDDRTTLKYYTMKRVTEMRVREEVERLRAKAAELEGKHVQVVKELCEIEGKSPTYDDQWVECYNEERKKSGIPAFVPGSEDLGGYHKARVNLPQ